MLSLKLKENFIFHGGGVSTAFSLFPTIIQNFNRSPDLDPTLI